MFPKFEGKTFHLDFAKLWAGETVSLFGSQVTLLALPLTAIIALGASALQVGILMAAGSAPFLVFGLPAGAWVDRARRRPILIGANLGRAVLLASIPLAARSGLLRIEQLYAVAFLSGILTVFFEVAYRSFLPSLVERDRLLEANSRLEASSSIAQIAGPGLGGFLVQVLTAPIAITVDALSFAVSAAFLRSIRTVELAPVGRTTGARLRNEIGEGLRLVLTNRLLRAVAATAATFLLFDNVLFAVYILYMTRQLHIRPALIGVIFGLAGIGGLAAAILTSRIVRRVGIGRAMVGGIVLAALGELAIASARGPLLVTILMLILAEGAVEFGAVLFSINGVSLRQAITPDRLLGRVNATYRFLTWGTGPVGALLGGALGQTIGLRATVVVAGIGTLFAFLWVVFSPVSSLPEHPPMSEELEVTAPT